MSTSTAAPPRADDGLVGGARVRRRPSVARLVVVEAVAAAVLLAGTTGSVPAQAVVAGVGAVLLVVAFGRSGGRWWTDRMALRRAWRRRRRVGSSVERVVVGHDDRGSSVGIGCDAGGWYAAVAVSPGGSAEGGIGGSYAGELPVPALADLVADHAVPVSAVQVTTMVVPTPQYMTPAQAPAVASYLELARDVIGAAPPPIERRDWVAVRLTAADAVAAAHQRGGGTVGVHRALTAAVGRVLKALAAAGLTGEVLGPEALAEAVLHCSGVRGVAGGGPAHGEEWSSWASDGLVDVAFEVRDWPAGSDGPNGPAGAPTSSLLDTPAARIVCALELRPGRRRKDTDATMVTVRGLVRVAAEPPQLAGSVRSLTERAAAVGVRLRRLDGWHAPAAYASALTGGGPW